MNGGQCALQTYNQCEVDLFELLCKVLDQNLFTQVDWARNSYYFKDLKVRRWRSLLIGPQSIRCWNEWIGGLELGALCPSHLATEQATEKEKGKKRRKKMIIKFPFVGKGESVLCVCCSIIAAKRKVAHGLGYRLIENRPFSPLLPTLHSHLEPPPSFFFPYLASCVTCLAVVAE